MAEKREMSVAELVFFFTYSFDHTDQVTVCRNIHTQSVCMCSTDAEECLCCAAELSTTCKTHTTYRHDLLQVVQGGGCHADKSILVTWCGRWSEELPVRQVTGFRKQEETRDMFGRRVCSG